MRYCLLGGLAADHDGVPLDLGPPKQRAVLGILLLERDRVVPVDRIIELLWGDAGDKALASLQSYVSRLRSVLEPGRRPRDAARVLISQPPGYRLRVDRTQVDLYCFEDAVDAGLRLLRTGSHEAAADALESALGTWTGPLLPELEAEPFVRSAAQRVEELRLTTVEAAAEAHLAIGGHRRAATVMSHDADQHATRERLQGLLALALYRDGRQADALRVVAGCRRALVESAGLDPGQDLVRLESDMLARSPTLDWQRPPPTPTALVQSDVARPNPSPIEMIAREREVRVLSTQLAAVASGRGGVAVVIGEPGIGKTHLAEFAVTSAAGLDLATAWVRCPENGAVPSFWPITQLGHQLRLAGLIAVDHDRLDGEPGTHGSARFGLYRAVIAALGEVDQPTLLIIDDLQWADADTLRLLEHIAAHFTASQALLLVTTRPPDENTDPTLVACLSALARVSGVAMLTLSGLQVDDVAQWCAAHGGDGVPREVAELVHARTAGNPLFVKELTELLSSEDRLLDADAARAARAIPPGVQFVVRRRVSQLAPDTQQLLGVAAVVGQVFRLEALAAAIDRDPISVLGSLAPALEAGLVEEVGDRFAFSHALVADALASEVNAARRAQIHAAVARALAAEVGPGFGVMAAEIAHHAHQGILAGTGDLAIQASTSAARLATSRLADEDAAKHWEGVADALRRSRPSDVGARINALVASATALLRVDRVEPAKRHLLDAIETAEAAGLVEEMVRAATLYNAPDVWVAGRYGHVDAAVVGAIQRTLAVVPEDDHAARALLLGALAGELVFAPEAQHTAVCRHAEATARESNDPVILATVLNNQMLPLRPNSLDRRCRMVDEFRSIAATTSLDPELVYAMEFHHAECRLEVGELSRANEIETSAFGALDPNLSAKVQSKHDWLSAAIATATADYDDAERLIQEAFEGHRRGRLYDGDTLWMAGRLAVAQDIGGLEELLSFATTTASTSAYSRGAAEALAFALLELGSVDQARSVVAPFGPKAAFPDDYSTLCCAAAALHVRVELHDRPGAEVAAAQLVDYPERWAAAGSSPLSMGSVALALARFEAMRGDVGAARSSYLAAERFHESNGAVAWLARTLTHRGTFLVDIGDTGPGERALARARELADIHGFVYVRRRLDEVRV